MCASGPPSFLALQQEPLLRLAHGVARHRRDEADLTRAFVDGQTCRDEIGELDAADTLGHDERHDALPQVGIGDAHHRGLAHPRMIQQRVLDLSRPDPVPPDLIRSVEARPTIRCTPSLSTAAMSPVRNQPSSVYAAAVASGRPRYPENSVGPLTWSSPISAPGSATTRVATPSSAVPTVPGATGPPARPLTVIRVSVIPYRSTTWCPVSRSRSRNTGVGSAALPDTSSRARDSAAAASGTAAILDHTVGTPKNRLPPAVAAAAYASGVGRPVCTRRLPVRKAPSTPSTSPWTWNNGNPWTRTSCALHAHAPASASRSAVIAALLNTTPLGTPVVPDV